MKTRLAVTLDPRLQMCVAWRTADPTEQAPQAGRPALPALAGRSSLCHGTASLLEQLDMTQKTSGEFERSRPVYSGHPVPAISMVGLEYRCGPTGSTGGREAVGDASDRIT
jgi:hypothetical protein